MRSSLPRPHRADVLVLGVLGFAIAWEFLAATPTGSRPGRIALGFVVAAGAYVVGRAVSALSVPLAAIGVAVGVTVAVATHRDLVHGHPLSGPLGYENANGALCVLGVLACLVVCLRAGVIIAIPFALLAAALTATTFATRSKAADVLVVVLLLAVVPVGRRWIGSKLAAEAAVLVLVLSIGATVVLALAQHTKNDATGHLDRLLSSRRVHLWHDALELTRHHPGRGVGADRFAVTSPTALSDRDARWAHSEFLQQSAETGVPGGVALVLAFGAGCVALGRTGRRDAALVALGVGAIAAHSAIDYVLHYPSIGGSLALLVGSCAQQVARPVPVPVDDGRPEPTT